jgi:endogenous inhibitor of DNA gyrase (YacG/DUF329 family)
MKVKCPQCSKLVEYENNPYRPFCSDRCKIIDLGDWASGKYSVPVEDTSDLEIDAEEEKNSEDQD